RDAIRRCGASKPDRRSTPQALAGRRLNATGREARIGGARKHPCPDVRPSPGAPARSSTWPPGQEIPLYRQLANLGVKLGRLTLALLLLIARGARAAREQARDVVQNLLLPGIDLVRMHAVPLRKLGNRRFLASASSAILALNAASNFLRDFVISRSIGCDRAGHFTP